MRIAKSSKEQDGYEASDTTGARFSPEAQEGAPEATSRVEGIGRNRGDQAPLVISRNVATTSVPRYGFGRLPSGFGRLPSGKSSSPTMTGPEVATILIRCQRPPNEPCQL